MRQYRSHHFRTAGQSLLHGQGAANRGPLQEGPICSAQCAAPSGHAAAELDASDRGGHAAAGSVTGRLGGRPPAPPVAGSRRPHGRAGVRRRRGENPQDSCARHVILAGCPRSSIAPAGASGCAADEAGCNGRRSTDRSACPGRIRGGKRVANGPGPADQPGLPGKTRVRVARGSEVRRAA